MTTVRDVTFILDQIKAGRDVTGILLFPGCHTCPTCNGKGTTWTRTQGTRTCPRCGGSGSALRDLR